MYPGNVPFPAIKSVGGGSLGMNMPPPGRPVSANTNKLVVLPFANGASSAISLNVAPMKAAQDKFLKSGQLPPYLQPRRSRPVQHQTNRAISQGFTKPKSV